MAAPFCRVQRSRLLVQDYEAFADFGSLSRRPDGPLESVLRRSWRGRWFFLSLAAGAGTPAAVTSSPRLGMVGACLTAQASARAM
jgi:hypothetical protein